VREPFQDRTVLLLLALVVLSLLATACSQQQVQAVYNVLDFRWRRLQIRWFGLPTPGLGQRGVIRGRVYDADGHPLADAVVLVATATGEVYDARSDKVGRYRIEQVPAGVYVPAAGKWGYEESILRLPDGRRAAVAVHAGLVTDNVDMTLKRRQLIRPPTDVPIGLSPPLTVTEDFPGQVYARLITVTFPSGGLVLSNTLIYEPITATHPLPTLLTVYPSPALNWNPASVAFASQGLVVVAVGPASARGLDIDGHARDVLQVATLLRAGRLSSYADPNRLALLNGSFGSLILFRALPDLPDACCLVQVGGVSDGFLGVQALYREDLQIPPPYDAAVAALGRPDWYPDVLLRYSPAFYATDLPPTLVIHTQVDRVIPYDQAIRFDQALAAAGTPHQLLLYEDVTHYLNVEEPSPAAAEMFWTIVQFLRKWGAR